VFGSRLLAEIDIDCVDAYKAHKLRESAKFGREWDRWRNAAPAERGKKPDRRPLGPRAINLTLVLLSAILESASERDLITRNPARGKRRRVKEAKPKRTQLDTATAIAALLDAAGELDTEQEGHPQPGPRLLPRRAILMGLLLSGLRIGELIDTRWGDVDPANGRIQYDSKTPAGRRWVRLLPALREELTALKQRRDPHPEDRLFGTAAGGRQWESNIRQRVLVKAVERANAKLAEAGEGSLPHLTPHSCRRTYASIRYALGASPADVMAELGHTNPSLALAVYAQAMRMSDEERTRLLIGQVEGSFEELTLAVGERHRIGDLLVVEWSNDYGDGAVYRNVTLAEIEDGKAVRVTDYWGKPFDTPEWRKAMTARLDMPPTGRWPSRENLSHH
jgi:integrase